MSTSQMCVGVVICSSMDNFPVAWTPEKNGSPSPSSGQLPITSQLGVGPWTPSIIHAKLEE